MEILQKIFFPTQFIPHGHCYLWQPELVWLHLLSDVLIAIAYYSIPIMLIYFVRKRDDVPFRGIFLLFGLFITTCGTTHLMAVWTLWHPAYWLSGTIKAITAVVSIYTALSLIPTIPAALALPKPEALRQINQQLGSEIEDRKQAEAQLHQLNQELEARVEARTADLRDSEQRLRSLFEAAPDFIYVLDQQGLIQQVNSTTLEQSGYAESDLIGQPLDRFLSSDSQALCQQEFTLLMTHGNHRQEMEFVCKNGQILTMDCSCTVVADDCLDAYILVLQRDITQRKQIETERTKLFATLQESEQRWSSFLRDVRLMVIGVDSRGQVDYANPYFLSLMDYRLSDILGKNWVESFIPPYQQPQIEKNFQDILNHENRPRYQSTLVTKTGEERIISWTSTLQKTLEGTSAGVLSIGEDVTERYAIDRMKDEFISVVSHELRTPLTSIHGALDLLTSGLLEPQSDRGQHALAIAAESSSRLVQLVNDILELERLESGKVRLHWSSVSTHELIQRACEVVELMAERGEIRLEMVETDLCIWADGDRLIQVLTNLLSNAIKFSEPSSTIWVTVEEWSIPEGSQVRFTVKDQGRGIPPNKLERIFERFHQVDASDSRSKGGTGLGLAICSSIVQQHGGKIWVESILGEGSSFSFTVPRCQSTVLDNAPLDNFPKIKNE
ncbi:PAS domain-containing sensor histidine kinase [Leptothoe sp. PORK10 BA2]|uniref:PAS domain-containing sensor histidine kinase n=1 Tax=Leptothoe sp. PORK10 BA2 TaxID=3110254 RepID=UPI002B20AB90|nr:PAS domain S-box protein [Leptothoe sp. PORK10 BA2]MEA5464978.1 PAS domain S-box protein [Leptothoe sp. PORK10 BA2]